MKNLLLAIAITFSTTLIAQDAVLKTPLKTLDNKTTSVQELSKENDLMIVSLWATWCVPCINELDAISDVYDDWQDETGVKLYAVSIDDSRTARRIRPLVNGKGWEYDILLDKNNDLKRALGTATVPLTLIVKNGEIVYKHSGYTPGAEDELYEELKKHK